MKTVEPQDLLRNARLLASLLPLLGETATNDVRGETIHLRIASSLLTQSYNVIDSRVNSDLDEKVAKRLMVQIEEWKRAVFNEAVSV
jgi:hypothetical protein